MSAIDSPLTTAAPREHSMATDAETKVRIEDLPAMHLALARAFGEAGIGGKALDSVFAEAVHAKCLGCGISVTGTELGQIAITASKDATVESKLDRLRLGYCARNGCASKFYVVDCESFPGVTPSQVLSRAQALLHQPAPEPEPDPVDVGPPQPWFRKPKWVVTVVLLVGLAAVAYRYAADQGMVPGVKKKPVYQTDPARAREAL